MKKSVKLISLLLVFILAFSTLFLTSCKKTADNGAADTSNPYIIKTEIKDGCIWVTYSDNPDTPVNVGAFGVEGNTRSDGSLSYLPLPNGTYGVTAGNARYLEEIVIPESYNGKPISTILENAFNGATNLKKITIPSTITSVGENAFDNCGKLTYNEYDGARYLGNDSNPYLVLVDAKETSIVKCTVNNSTVAICDDAFYNCANLQVLTIPNSVTSIGARAFYNCSRLGAINFPEGSTFIGSETFYGCTSLESINIPASVSNIGTSAFANCKSLTTVTFAKNSTLTNIGNAVFSNCIKLKTITLPKNVVNIGDHKANKNTDGVFYGCESLESVVFEEGSSLNQIGNYAFDACESLTTIKLPDTLTKLGISAFRSSGIKTIALPNSLTSIGQETFYACTSLEEVTLGNATNSIGIKAFASCSKLNSIELPESVKYVGSSAFYQCSSLSSLTVKNPANWYAVGKKLVELDKADMGNPATAAKFATTDYYDHSFEK